MADQSPNEYGIRPPPARTERGHPLPRRALPEQSVTLYHHQLARDASVRAKRSAVGSDVGTSARRTSLGESNVTHHSDAQRWFDKSNQNPTATLENSNEMDVDPPFYQQETDSSNELELPPRIHTQYGHVQHGHSHLRPAATRQSSSADDFRSVIDDLTIENQRLKEELKRYKQSGSDMMKKDKLFEIKVHGLPNGKKRELEATLRDFASSLEGSSETASQERRTKPGRHMKNLYASRNSLSKHASSSSTNSRPVDSAYASMSTGPSTAAPQSSTGPSLHGPPSFSAARTMSSDRKFEGYLLDTPEGLLPRHTAMTDREKKKLVVRRLEQLFTGKISGRNMHRVSMPSLKAQNLTDASAILQPPHPEAVREAPFQSSDTSGEKPRSRDLSSNSGDRTELGGAHGAGDSAGSGNRVANNESPTNVLPPEQRPTRPRDLDPDRVQVPGENIDYIRHLGIVRPEFLLSKKTLRHDVAADADGWVYLNLLCNLAQLHMINVTPAFIRSAVSEKSTKFQLSPDGRKIRWRGGTDGTKFSSDSSADNNSPKSPSTDEGDSTKGGERKKRKTSAATDAQTPVESIRGSGSKSLLGQVSAASSNSFHYKPLFVHRSSSLETSSADGKSSPSVLDERTPDKSPWDLSGSSSAQRKKRRRDGAIIYYSGAQFCTDLSGDRGDISPTTYMNSDGQERDLDLRAFRPIPHRSWSGSSMLVRPLSDDRAIVEEALDMDLDDSLAELITDDGDSGIDLDFELPWCDNPTSAAPISFPLEPCLEPCGLGGVMPEDHFAVVCYTRHPVLKVKGGKLPRAARGGSEELLEAIAGRLACMSASSPAPPQSSTAPSVDMTYLSGRLRRLDPVPLPPPAMFIPPFSSDSSSDAYDDGSDSDDEGESELEGSSESLISKLGNPRLSDNAYPESGNTSSNDDINAHERMVLADPIMSKTGSSGATAGDGQESGYSSSVEDGMPSE
ncbi:hypothetical protein CONLIGDRAFT_476245 [Coniochaeta ligniaria NRRL 30616]|uniref:Frequency clock protein n=1 Tax=Coniochaeta ligniaria NRRL 30616 TaxID=1408157 RepID=A0A1J7IGK7_9PEZI|nr:hypothetical protein CONLIGDRAFT_476245 [Coniochaeta ligniaria NRRL 30616]